MTEKEKLALARKYIDYLARGFNPIDESPISNDDVVRNIKISRCLLYVSDVLGEVIEKGIADSKNTYYSNKKQKAEFSISYEDRERFIFSSKPLTVSEIANAISELIDQDKVKPLKATVINEWFVQNGFLYEEAGFNGKKNKCVTEEGRAIGIIETELLSQSGAPYKRITHSIDSQQFIIDNLDSIIEYNSIRSSVKKAEKAEKKYLNKKSAYTGDILDEVILDFYAAGATADDIAIATDQDSRYIIQRMKVLKLI